MKKSLIAQGVTALVAGLALTGAVHAAVVGPAAGVTVDGQNAATDLVINGDGIGHINYIPYYTAQGGYDTYVNIVNSDMRNGKAVKVRFRGASNSDDVFDFTLLLSPGDKFAFAVTKDASGVARIALPGDPNRDTSCTLGGTTNNGINALNGEKFVTARLNPALTGAALSNETLEGYVELLTMADIPPQKPTSATVSTLITNPLFTAIKHVKDANGKYVAPCDLASLAPLATNPTSYLDAQVKGLEVPTTGLFTNWTLINVAKASSYTGAATAVEARELLAAGAATAPNPTPYRAGYGNIVLYAQNNASVADGEVELITADRLLRDTLVAPANYDFPDLSTPYLNSALTGGVLTVATRPYNQAVQLSEALLTTSVSNEFNTFSGLSAKTDFVFSFPTRRYNIAFDYKNSKIIGSDLSTAPVLAGGATPRNFFVERAATGTGDTGFASASGNVVRNPDDAAKAYQLCVTGISFQPATGAAVNEATLGITNRYTSPVTNDYDEWLLGAAAPVTQFVISPSTPGVVPTLAFCGEVAVFKLGAAAGDASVLGATVATKGLTLPYANGWMRLATPGLTIDSAASAVATTYDFPNGQGLPMIGFAATELNNTGIGTVGAGYGQTFPHRMTRPNAVANP